MVEIERIDDISERMLDIRDFEAAKFIAGMCAESQDVLVIGPSYGRDSIYLSRLGKNVVNLDIAIQKHLQSFVLGDAVILPFKCGTFDCVVLSAVIEHIYEDCKALREVRRVLKDSGALVMMAPFYHDIPEFHVRIYSPQTIRRLMGHCGFEIVDYVEIGGLISLHRLIMPVLRHLIVKETYVVRILEGLTDFDYFLGKKRQPILALSGYYGCYIKAKKGDYADTRVLNIKTFSHNQSNETVG